MITGLSKIEANPGCQIFTDDYYFYAKTEITIEAEFFSLPRKINFTFQDNTLSDLTTAYMELSQITQPQKRSIESVKIWLDKEKAKTMVYQRGIWAFVIILILIFLICGYLAYTYLKYKHAKRANVKSQDLIDQHEMVELNQAN